MRNEERPDPFIKDGRQLEYDYPKCRKINLGRNLHKQSALWGHGKPLVSAPNGDQGFSGEQPPQAGVRGPPSLRYRPAAFFGARSGFPA